MNVRSDLYAALARTFSFPDRAFMDWQAAGGWEALERRGRVELPAETRGLSFPAALKAPSADTRMRGEEYLRLFELERPAACRLYEGCLVDPAGREGVLAELVRFYEHFGLAADPSLELPDHLSVELAFMHFLTEKETRLAGPIEDVRRAERDFLDRHLLRAAAKVNERVRKADEGFYAAAAGLLTEFTSRDRSFLAQAPSAPCA